MAPRNIKLAQETSPRKVFLWALEWPGWCRSGRDVDSALDALLAVASRYSLVAAGAGLDFPADVRFETVAEVEGEAGRTSECRR